MTTNKVKAIPDDYQGAIPYLCCKDAARALEFYKKAFSAKERERFPMPDGRIGHAEVRIGKAVIMLADEFPEMDVRSPKSIGGSPVTVMVYVENVDAVVKQAAAAGAKILTPVADQFYGDRNSKLEDPFGHIWMISTHKEDVALDELKKRAAAKAAQK